MSKIPKLSPDNVESVKKAADSDGSFEPLPEGRYLVRLEEVEAKTSKAGNPMWTWTMKVDEGERKGASLWEHTVIQDNAMWKLAQMFRAFGGDPDQNTEEMYGNTVSVMVEQRVIGAGKRKGEMGNEIVEYLPNPDQVNGSSETKPPKDDLPF